MSVEVAFETPEQISEKLARYERLFQDRYTDRDEGYLLCLQQASKMLNVPVMSPWPPRGSYHHRGGGGGGGGGGRYSYDDWDGRGRGRRRGFRGDRHRDYRYPPYHHPRYYDDRPPPPHPPWDYEPRPPRDDFRERSPLRAVSPLHHHRRHDSSSPPPYPPPPPPPHHLSPRPHSSHLSPHHRPHYRSHSHSPVPRSRSPWREGEGESASEQEAPPPVPHPLTLDLVESEEKTSVPSESDVLDILSSAHAPQSKVTAENLHKAQLEGKKSHRSRQGDKYTVRTGKKLSSSGHGGVKNQDDLTSSSEERGVSLLVTHGKTEVVSTSYLLGRDGGGKRMPQKKIRRSRPKKSVITDSEEEGEREGGAGGSVPVKDLQESVVTAEVTGRARKRSVVVEVTGTGLGREGEVGLHTKGEREEGLVMRLDKRLCRSISSVSDVSHSVPNTPSSDLTPTFSQTTPTPSQTTPTQSLHTHRDLRVVCSRLPPTSIVTRITATLAPPLSPPPAPPSSDQSKEKKRKKTKKKKKKHIIADDSGKGSEMITHKPLKLKISLGRPHTTS